MMENIEECTYFYKLKNSPDVRQGYSSAAALITILSIGYFVGFPTILFRQLSKPDTPIPLDVDQMSWIASSYVIPLAMFTMISGCSLQRFGRKKAYYTAHIFTILGWIITAASNSASMIIVGRIFHGTGAGLLVPVNPMFIAETTAPKNRQFYSSGIMTSMECGLLIVHLLGFFFHWRIDAVLCTFSTIISAAMIYRLPDSPSWYMSRGEFEKYETAFRWYRGFDIQANEEKENMEKEKTIENKTFLEKIADLKRREFLIPLFIMISLFLMVYMSGDIAMSFYAIQIIENVFGNSVDAFTLTLITDAIRIATLLFTTFVMMRNFKRKTIITITSSCVFISLCGLSVSTFLQTNNYISKQHFWISILFLVTHTISLPMGMLQLPWMTIGEIFPLHLKGFGSGITLFFSCSSMFIIAKTTPAMFASLGAPLTFAVYAMFVLIMTIVILAVMPETKGKTLIEIQQHFKKRRTEVANEFELQNLKENHD